ncbi:hypothetical protein LWQ05_004042 [Salmonella enterica]|nr:hypothetical protein [Salmonella enterica]
MKLNVAPLLARARFTTAVRVDGRMEVLVMNEVVDAHSGERTEVTAGRLRGLSLWETAKALHSWYAGDTVFVVRTPAAFAIVRPAFSELPVHYAQRGETVDVWVGMETPAVLVNQPPAFDLDYLAGSLANHSWVTPATGLAGVTELLSGAVLLVDGGRLQQVDLLASAVLELQRSARSYSEEVEHFRELTLRSVAHKGRQYPEGFAVKCSGGVDSAVVAVAAAQLYPEHRLPLINSYSEEDLHGDERYYLDAVADRIGGRRLLVETNARSSRTGLSSELLAATTRPCKMSGTIATTAQLHEVAQAHGARMVLSGDGGDQLFLKNWRALFAREVIAECRSPAAALRAMAGLAIQDRCSFWKIASEVVSGRRVRRYRAHFYGDQRFPRQPLAARAVPAGAELIPNGSRLGGLGVSRAFQFFGMRNAELNRARFRSCGVDERKPFVFWPIIRAAIAARREHHLQGGMDRALERDAFRAELPEVDYDTAFALVRARAIADWMGFYEQN